VNWLKRVSLVAGFCWIVVPSLFSAELINSVRVEGNVHVNESEILAVVQTTVGDDFSLLPTKWKIRDDFYRIWDLGYFADMAVSRQQSGAGWDVFFQVVEKPLLADITYTGNSRYKKKKLDKEIGFSPKTDKIFFDEMVPDRFQQKILTYYTEQSFPNTKISWKIEEDKEANTVVLVYEIQEGERLPVREIVFQGNTVLNDKELKKHIQTKKSWWILVKHHYDDATADMDLDRIRMAYWNYGYLDAVVTKGPVDEISKGLSVTFLIEEGQPYKVNSISLEGNTIFSSEELKSQLTLSPGDTFSAATLRQNELAMLDRYREQGYLDTMFPSLESQLIKNQEDLLVDIQIPIKESSRKYLGDIKIQGVVVMEDGVIEPLEEGEFGTKEYVITREIDMEKGAPLDWTKVVKSDRELVNLNFFKSRPFPVPGQMNLIPGFQRQPTDDPNVEDLLLQLEEIQTGSITFGGGYSTSFGPSVFASIAENNLFGYGVRGSLTGEIGTYRNRFSIGLMEPYLFGSDFSADWSLYYRDLEGYGGRSFDEKRIGTSILFGYELSEELDFLFGLKAEQTDLSPDADHGFALNPATIPNVYNLGENTTTSLTFGFVHDLRDFKLNPSSGTYLRSTVELAGLTDNEFVKWRNTGHYYKQVYDRLILALSTEVNLAHAYGKPGFVPLQERFFVGGARSIRGFDEYGIGDFANIMYMDPAYGGFRSYLGGEAAWVNNVELRYGFSEIIQGVWFFDGGSNWPEIGDVDPSDFRFSTGLGLRIRVPGLNATLSLDFPYVLRKFDTDDTEFFHFSFGQTF
jgi:outer membrane protein insertion porin family